MQREYGGFVWTDHAIQRMRERGVKQGDAWATLRNPDKSRPPKVSGEWVYYKTFGKETIEVVATQNNKKEWVVVSVWSKPASTQGGPAHQKPSQKASLGLRILRAIFGVKTGEG